MNEIHVRSRGHLPHWEADKAIYFVTFRLADSLPSSVIDLARDFPSAGGSKAREIEQRLDSGMGPCHLRILRIAEVVRKALQRFDGLRYRLFAWCIMPNHVHVVFQPKEPNKLAEILHSWKSYSAQRANMILSRRGALWQREYYDHLIRDGKQLDRAIRYTAENPLKANLKNWPWVYVARNLT